MITDVSINHEERNYFGDNFVICSDWMVSISGESIAKAIDKLNRRFKRHGVTDCLFVHYSDGTAYRLMYDYDLKNFDPKNSVKELRLRHYVNMSISSWDTEEVVTVAQAKRMILGTQND